MDTQDLVFYGSENGDEWLLLYAGGGSVIVRHQANAASGGAVRDVDLAAFIAREHNTPQSQALRHMLEDLVTDSPTEGESELLATLRSRRKTLHLR